MLTNKYGGYANYEDPATAVDTYQVALTGTNAAASSFHWTLHIPLEIVQRDPIGPVASVNNTAALTLNMTVNTSANLYSTPPTTFGTVRIRGSQVFYWEPKTADKHGRPISDRPPASGTTQYWTQNSITVPSGTFNGQVGTAFGYPWRSYLFMLVRSSGTRANGDADWPDPLIGLKFEANMLQSNLNKAQWKHRMARDYGYPNPNAFNSPTDTRLATVANVTTNPSAVVPGLENGVYALNFNKDFAFGKPGSETRRTYLQTAEGSNWIFNGSFGNAGTLYSIVNYVAPPGGQTGDAAALTGGR